jgi:hypothetical protein
MYSSGPFILIGNWQWLQKGVNGFFSIIRHNLPFRITLQ